MLCMLGVNSRSFQGMVLNQKFSMECLKMQTLIGQLRFIKDLTSWKEGRRTELSFYLFFWDGGTRLLQRHEEAMTPRPIARTGRKESKCWREEAWLGGFLEIRA